MGKEDDNLHASIAHIVLVCVAGRGISTFHGKSFVHPGMHANFFIHGILGFLHYQSGILDNDLKTAYTISLQASKYIALPCLMADVTRSDQVISMLHLLSGAVPFVLALTGNDNPVLGNLMIACNIIAICYYSFENDKEWGWYTAAASVGAYFLAPFTPPKGLLYPLALAVVDYCGILGNDFNTAYMISLQASKYIALPCLMADLMGRNKAISLVHLLSGAVPFGLAISGNENAILGNLAIACNIAALCHYSHENKKQWGWYTAASAALAYFLVPYTPPKGLLYPLALCLVEYCTHIMLNYHPLPPASTTLLV